MREHKTSLIKYKFLTVNSINDSIFGSIRFEEARGRTMDKVVAIPVSNLLYRSASSLRMPGETSRNGYGNVPPIGNRRYKANPEGIATSSPGLRACELPWVRLVAVPSQPQLRLRPFG